MLSGGCSWFNEVLEDDGDVGAEAGTREVVFGEFAMENQNFGNGFVNIREVQGNVDETETSTRKQV